MSISLKIKWGTKLPQVTSFRWDTRPPLFYRFLSIFVKKLFSSTAGFEPAIFWSVVRRVIRCATRPVEDSWPSSRYFNAIWIGHFGAISDLFHWATLICLAHRLWFIWHIDFSNCYGNSFWTYGVTKIFPEIQWINCAEIQIFTKETRQNVCCTISWYYISILLICIYVMIG